MVASCAVAAAVLSGALVVGDSVRGSLRDLTLERLGEIDLALQAASFFRQDLAARLDRELDGATVSVATILTPGSVRRPGGGARASGVSIQGTNEAFLSLFPASRAGDGSLAGGETSPGEGGATAPPVVINDALRRELEVEEGDSLLLSFERPAEAPRGTLLASPDTEDVVRELRVRLAGVVPDRGLGRFNLQPHQGLPLLAFVELDVLQEALGQAGRANTLLVNLSSEFAAGTTAAQEALRRVLTLDDVGLEVEEGSDWISVESRQHILSPVLAEEIEELAAEASAPRLAVSTYLANRFEAHGRSVPYSAITAFETGVGEPFGPLVLVGGEAAPRLGEGEGLVNQWLADDLGVAAGDEITMTYYEVGPREELRTRETRFRVRGIVALRGLGADAGLTPEFPGIHDAEDMAAWDPPFPIDLSAIRPRDEAFWDEYGATPKAFFPAATADLWATRFGRWTSVRLAPPPGEASAEFASRVREELPARIDPGRTGLRFDAVRERGLEAARGATDFRMLFLGFSLFLIVAAALLVGLFFSLGIDRRAGEVGLLLAVGLPVAAVRRRFLREGAVLSAVGIVVGGAGAVGYAALMMTALRSWWRAAVGTPYLYLHVEPLSLALGSVIAFCVVLASIFLALRRLGGLSLVGLLRGETRAPEAATRPRRARGIAWLGFGLGAALLVAALAAGQESSPAFFFAAGAALLVGGLALYRVRLVRPRARLGAPGGRYLAMAARNAGANPGRSLLCVALVSSASFVIVAVAANGFRYGSEVDAKDSAAGGYTLMAESAVPLHRSLSSPETGVELGLSDATREILARSEVLALRVLPGDDVSCLNLYQPQSPRILGVPPQQAERGGFRFQRLVEKRDNPWTLLFEEREDGVVPAFGDNESMTWILKLGLGDELVIENERGEPVTLRLVGLLEKSLFQSEILISEASFEHHFPSRSGYSAFLFDPPRDRSEELAEGLEAGLDAYGFDATSTQERLQRFQAVFNTYLATFQTLGGLGLLLGTLGLAAILLRNVMERRGELATLRALGFRRRSLGLLVVAENGLLLAMGVAIGSAAALLAVAPHLVTGNAMVPWGSLAATLLLILAVGMLASVAAVRSALRAPLLAALKGE